MPRGKGEAGKAKTAGSRPVITAPRGTIRPHKGFGEEEALAQAKTLRKALQKPINTDAVIGVLTKFTVEERKYIEDVYNVQHTPTLREALRREFSCNLQATLLALLQWPNQLLADWAQRALSGATADRKTLVELLCARPQPELRDVVRAYRRLHGQSLEAALGAALSGPLRELALALARLQRDEAEPTGDNRARQLAERLAQAAAARDAAPFMETFGATGDPLMRKVVAAFPSVSAGGADLESAIRAGFSGDLQAGLLTVVQCVSDQPAYFAERLYRAMKGLGTDDATLIRVLVSRSEIDLENIKESYQRRYGKSLAAAVEDDTSGYYWRCLRAIIKP